MAGTVLTKQGRSLQAKAQAGASIHYTKIMLGDGVLGANDSLEDLTALIHPILMVGIQDVAVLGDGTSRVRALVSNQSLDTSFFVREIGVFADDPDEGEILYSVVNRGAQASFLQSKQGSEVVEQVLDLITVVGNVNNVTAVINSSLTTATKQDLNMHDANPYAHQAAIQNSVSSGNGWIKFADGTMLQHGSDGTSSDGSKIIVFPLAFDGGLQGGWACEASVGGWGPLSVNNPTLTVYGVTFIDHKSMQVRVARWQAPDFIQVGGCHFYWMAIGRWKA